MRPLDWGHLGARAGGPGRLAAKVAGSVYDLVRPSVLRGFDYEVLGEASPELSDFLGQASARSTLHIERSLAYLQWRFRHPAANHEHLLLRSSSGELVGWAAFDEADALGVSRLRVGDLWVSEPRAERESALCAALIAEGRKRGCEQVYAIARTPSESMLRGTGLVCRPTAMPVIALAPLGFDLGRLSAWEYREADADMF